MKATNFALLLCMAAAVGCGPGRPAGGGPSASVGSPGLCGNSPCEHEVYMKKVNLPSGMTEGTGTVKLSAKENIALTSALAGGNPASHVDTDAVNGTFVFSQHDDSGHTATNQGEVSTSNGAAGKRVMMTDAAARLMTQRMAQAH